MKKISIVFLASFCLKIGYSQSQLLKGTILPNSKKGTLFLPQATKMQLGGDVSENIENIILIDGQPTIAKNILPLNNTTTSNTSTIQQPSFLDLNGGNYDGNNGAVLFTSNSNTTKKEQPKYIYKKNEPKLINNSTKTVVGFTKDGLPSLIDNSYTSNTNSTTTNTRNSVESLPSLLDGDTKNIKTNNINVNSNTFNNQTNNQLAPLNDNRAKQISPSFQSNVRSNIETVSPTLMNGQKNISQNNQGNNNQTLNGYKMPPLASVNLKNDAVNTAIGSKFSMPALASIEGATSNIKKNGDLMPQLAPIEGGNLKENTSNNGMPALAPLEQLSNKNNSNNGMPELAAIEGDNNTSLNNQNQMPELVNINENNINKPNYQTIINSKNGKVKTNLKGLIMPPGTTLTATDKRSYIFKPTIPVDEAEIEPGFDNNSFKPSAGGGMGLAALTPMESISSTIINTEITPVTKVETITKPTLLPALTPLNNIYQYQQSQPQQRVIAQPSNYQSQQQLLQAAKNHQHDPNNPCCKVQQYKKKVAYKKPAYRYKRVYRQPMQQQVEYIYEQPEPVERIIYVQSPTPQRQRETVERIVYVPSQTRQQTEPVVKKIYTQEIQQPVKQQDSRVVYRDYTNTYTKPIEKNNNCNCPNTSNQPVSKDGKKYYSAANYDPNLVAGPTSGDYPIAGRTSEINMKYSFYINGRGKYSVGLFNDYCTILLQQNGKVVEYKVNGDPSADPSTYRPRLNYFGSPETIAGIPIEYNYNRSVHKIGSIKFEYDFEGFFKSVGSSQVLYTSRSSLQSVDGVRVNYDAMGNVSNVDANNGIIQYNPDNQSNQNSRGN